MQRSHRGQESSTLMMKSGRRDGQGTCSDYRNGESLCYLEMEPFRREESGETPENLGRVTEKEMVKIGKTCVL